MKRNNYDEIIKKVAIASLSLIVTGGIAAGVMNYNGGNTTTTKSVVSAETIETVKETKSVEGMGIENGIYRDNAIYYLSENNKLHAITNVSLNENTLDYEYASDSKDEIIAEGVASIFYKNEGQINVIKMEKGFKKLSDNADSEALVYSNYDEWGQREKEREMFNNL